MPAEVVSALITALTTLVVFIAKDWIFAKLSERRIETKKETQRLRLYIEPLVVSAKNLFWRLHEVFDSKGRGSYLRKDAPNCEYTEYKRSSTLYRIASLLGWKRAFRKELNLVTLSLLDTFQDIEKALNEIEKALADGSSAELQRLDNILELWTHLKVPSDRRIELAIKVERELDIADSLSLFTTELAIPDDSNLFETVPVALSRLFKRELGKETSESIVNETRARLVNSLCIREAWIYRDWQDAIGDLMCIERPGEERKFDVIGFQRFLHLCESGEASDRNLLSKLERLLKDIDLSKESDTRVQVLWKTYISSARFVKEVASAFPDTNLLSEEELKVIEQIAISETKMLSCSLHANSNKQEESE